MHFHRVLTTSGTRSGRKRPGPTQISGGPALTMRHAADAAVAVVLCDGRERGLCSPGPKTQPAATRPVRPSSAGSLIGASKLATPVGRWALEVMPTGGVARCSAPLSVSPSPRQSVTSLPRCRSPRALGSRRQARAPQPYRPFPKLTFLGRTSRSDSHFTLNGEAHVAPAGETVTVPAGARLEALVAIRERTARGVR